MIALRRSAERSHLRDGDQETWRTFFPGGSAGQPGEAFGILTGLDEVRLPPNVAAAARTDADEESVIYVYRGALAQEDSTGGSGVVCTGEFQCLTTGRRVRHGETNTSWSTWAHVFRVSLLPAEADLPCAREQRRFAAAQRRNLLCVVASRDGRKGSLRLHQDALVCSSILDPGHHLFHDLAPGRIAWLHVVHGEVQFGDLILFTGDGAGVTNGLAVSFTAREESEILLLVLAGETPRPIRSGSAPGA
jgi:hypothetical protein